MAIWMLSSRTPASSASSWAMATALSRGLSHTGQGPIPIPSRSATTIMRVSPALLSPTTATAPPISATSASCWETATAHFKQLFPSRRAAIPMRSRQRTSTATGIWTSPWRTREVTTSASFWAPATALSSSPAPTPPATAPIQSQSQFRGPGSPLDLVVANNGSSNDVSVLLGNGDGTFQAAVSYPAGSGPFYVAVADLGNGTQDLIVADSNSGTAGVISVLIGNGDGTFQAAHTYAAGNAPRAIAVGDFDGNGTLDLAVGNYSGNNISILEGNGDGTFQAARNIAGVTGPYQIVAIDVNADGILDLVESGDGGVQVLLGNGDGTFQQPAWTYIGGPSPRPVAVVDLNGDT